MEITTTKHKIEQWQWCISTVVGNISHSLNKRGKNKHFIPGSSSKLKIPENKRGKEIRESARKERNQSLPIWRWEGLETTRESINKGFKH